MRETSPQTYHQPGHDRAPGPDPVPTRRRSTQPSNKPQEVKLLSPIPRVIPVSSTPAPAAKPRKGKSCGSGKPRYILTKALIKKALAEGYYELLEEREERFAERQAATDANPNTAAATPGVQDSREQLCIVTCIVGEDGQERMQYHPVGGKDAPATTENKPRSLEEIWAEQKIHRLLADMKEIQVVINVGALVQAAKQDPKLFKMLQETKVPSKKSPPSKAGTDRKGSAVAAQVTRPSMGISYRPALRGKAKGSQLLKTSSLRSKAGGKKKFH